MKLNIAQAHTGLAMLSHGIPNTQPENNKCTVQLSVLQGTLDRPSSEMTVVQVQSLVNHNYNVVCLNTIEILRMSMIGKQHLPNINPKTVTKTTYVTLVDPFSGIQSRLR